jgi:hypothetical protein
MWFPVIGKFGCQIPAQLIKGEDGFDLAQLTVAPYCSFAFDVLALTGCYDSLPGTTPVGGDVPFE